MSKKLIILSIITIILILIITLVMAGGDISSFSESITGSKKIADNNGIILTVPVTEWCDWKPDRVNDGKKVCNSIIEVNNSKSLLNISSSMLNLALSPVSAKSYTYYWSNTYTIKNITKSNQTCIEKIPKLDLTECKNPESTKCMENANKIKDYQEKKEAMERCWKDIGYYDKDCTKRLNDERILEVKKCITNEQEKEWTNWKDFSSVEKSTTTKGEIFALKVVYDIPQYSSASYNFSVTNTKDSWNAKIDPDISECGTLSSAGTYLLNQSITTTSTCFKVTAHNVIIDCNGSSVTLSSGSGYAVDSSKASDDAYTNLTVQNCTFVGFTDAVYARGADMNDESAKNGGKATIIKSFLNGIVNTGGGDSYYMTAGTGSSGGNAGAIIMNNSNASIVSAVGGSGVEDIGTSGVGADIYIENSLVTAVASSGGAGKGLDCDGGNAGNIWVINSNATTIEATGGSSGAGAGNAGTGGTITITNSSVTVINSGGGSGLDTIGNAGGITLTNTKSTSLSANGGDSCSGGGWGGTILLTNSNATTITSNAGGGRSDVCYNGGGGAGGAVTLTNSNSSSISTIGGGTPTNSGGAGGAVTLTNSTAGNIDNHGADGAIEGAGDGATIILISSKALALTSYGGNAGADRAGNGGATYMNNSNATTITSNAGASAPAGSCGSGGSVTAINSNLSSISNYGGSGTGGGLTGGGGGTITLTNVSTPITSIIVYGGGADEASVTGGAGGAVTLTNAQVTTITNYGGLSGNDGGQAGGNGGNVILNNANATIITSYGGDAGYAGQAGGNGGTVIFTNTNINLTNGIINIVNGSGFSGGGVAGTLTLNYSSSFIDTNSTYLTGFKLKVINKNYGTVIWASAVASNLNNLSANVIIGNNSAFVNSTRLTGLNNSANITLYGIGNRGFSIPVILKDGVQCTNCYNFTSLTAQTVIFNVTNWSNYTIGEGDITAPSINLTYPINNTWLNYSTVHINYTVSDAFLQSCWYSNDTYTSNTTLINCANITLVTWAEGQHNVTIWANDSAGNTNNSRVKFYIDSTLPLISYSTLTEANNTSFSRNFIQINVSVNEINFKNITYTLKNDTSIVNLTTYTTLINWINWTNLPNANYTYNVSIYDITENFNSTETRRITLDTVNPSINLTYPLNKTYTSIITALNYTVLDTNLQSCWYSKNGGITNTSVTCGSNLTGLNSGQGSKKWMIASNDSAGNRNVSYVTFFVDSISPIVTLILPEDNTQDTDGVLRLIYTPSDTNTIKNCSLNYQGGVYATATSVSNGVQNIIEVINVAEGHPLYMDELRWNVSCTDELNNKGNSSTRILDTKYDISGSEGGASQSTSPEVIAQKKNPLSISIIYSNTWIRGTDMVVELLIYNKENSLYTPENISFSYDENEFEIKDKKIIDNKVIVTFATKEFAELGEKQIKLTVTDERELEHILTFNVQDKPIETGTNNQLILRIMIGGFIGIAILIIILIGVFWDKLKKKKPEKTESYES